MGNLEVKRKISVQPRFSGAKRWMLFAALLIFAFLSLLLKNPPSACLHKQTEGGRKQAASFGGLTEACDSFNTNEPTFTIAPAASCDSKMRGPNSNGELFAETQYALRTTHDAGRADWLDKLIDKLCIVESGGPLVFCRRQKRGQDAVGDDGEAAGPLQLHREAVDDVNRFYGVNFSYNDRQDPSQARQIAKLYMVMWLRVHRDELAARIFNGGPRGWEKDSTVNYWKKVEGLK